MPNKKFNGIFPSFIPLSLPALHFYPFLNSLTSAHPHQRSPTIILLYRCIFLFSTVIHFCKRKIIE